LAPYATLGSKVSNKYWRSPPAPTAIFVSVLQKRREAFAKIMLARGREGRVVENRSGPPGPAWHRRTSGAQEFDRIAPGRGQTRRFQVSEDGRRSTRRFIETDGQRRRQADDLRDHDVAASDARAQGIDEAGWPMRQGHRAVFEPLAIPAVVFTDPEIAWTGLTEAQARAEGRDIEVAKFPWGALSRAVTIDRPDGVTKLVLDKKTGRVLGVGIAGSGAGELIAEGTLAIEMGATANDMKMTIHPHPTLSESLMEAAEVFFGQSTHVFKPKRR
jgi:hypothetical protein